MGRRHTAESRRRIARGLARFHAVRLARESYTPADIRALARPGGATRAEMRPLLEAAAIESETLLDALGGADRISPQRRILLDDFVRVGVVLRATLARYAQTADPECASRLGTLASVRRASLVAIGLDERREELDLRGYMAKRAADAQREAASNRSGTTDAGTPASRPGLRADRASSAECDERIDSSTADAPLRVESRTPAIAGTGEAT